MKLTTVCLCLWLGSAPLPMPQIEKCRTAPLDETFSQAVSSGSFGTHLAAIESMRNKCWHDYEFVWRAARAYVYAGDLLYLQAIAHNLQGIPATQVKTLLKRAAKFDKSQKERVYQMGKAAVPYAMRAVELAPQRIEGQYYATGAISLYAIRIGLLRAIREGLWKKWKRAVRASLHIHSAYSEAGPLRAKGRSYFAMPWPLRDLSDSENWLRRAVRRAPLSARNHLYLADTLYRRGKPKEALPHYDRAARLVRPLPNGKLSHYMSIIADIQLSCLRRELAQQ